MPRAEDQVMRPRGALHVTLAIFLAASAMRADAQQAVQASPADAPVARFRSAVNLVSVSAVVRDKRGKVMPALLEQDFEVFDSGQRRELLTFHSDSSAAASVAILVDGSGSMVLGSARDHARQISTGVLASLTPGRDAAALLSFDTRLVTLCDFTGNFELIRTGLASVEAFGSTSLYDAIAGSAALTADRAQNRRAVIVLSDGTDTTSTYSPAQVSWIASTIDVPVYVFAVGDGPVVREIDEEGQRPQPLAEIARATGGDFFVANTPELIAAAVQRVTEELRHQYVLAFESSSETGLRRLDVRTRKRDLKVTSRRWYQAGY